MPDDLIREVVPGERPSATWANRVVRALQRPVTAPNAFIDGTGTYIRRTPVRELHSQVMDAGAVLSSDPNANHREEYIAAHEYVDVDTPANNTSAYIFIKFTEHPIWMGGDWVLKVGIPAGAILNIPGPAYPTVLPFPITTRGQTGASLECTVTGDAGDIYTVAFMLYAHVVIEDFDFAAVTWNDQPAVGTHYDAFCADLRSWYHGTVAGWSMQAELDAAQGNSLATLLFHFGGPDLPMGGAWADDENPIYGLRLSLQPSFDFRSPPAVTDVIASHQLVVRLDSHTLTYTLALSIPPIEGGT